MERDGNAGVLGCAVYAEGSLSMLHNQQLAIRGLLKEFIKGIGELVWI